MANGLLDLLGGLGTTPPSYLEGLLGAQQTEDLRKRSIGTGLANALVGYLAMPKNQNLGLGRILAGTAQAGMQGAQGVYDTATQDYLQAQQMSEAQRKIDQQKQLQTEIAKITDPQERLYAQLAPEQWVANKAKATKSLASVLTPTETDSLRKMGYDIPEGALVQRDENNKLSIMEGTTPKTGTDLDLKRAQAYRSELYKANPNDPQISQWDDYIAKLTHHAPPPSVTVTNAGESEYNKKFGSILGESDAQIVQIARGAPETVATSRRIRTLLSQNPITGTGASALLPLSTALATAGITQDGTAATTQALVGELANVTLNNVKGSGLGAGQGFTDKDREFLEAAKSGKIDWTAANIKRVADLNERSAMKSIEKYDELRGRLKPEQQTFFGLNPIRIQGTRPTPVITSGR